MSLYVARFGAASAFVALPALLTASAPAFPKSVVVEAAWLAELFVAVGSLSMATWYLRSMPGRPIAPRSQPFRWVNSASSAYLVACLAPGFGS